MANNDKLNRVISNIKILSDLTQGMVGAEMYPVSFFSQAFDLLQEIQNDYHTLETEQVDLFEKQMKKHQALILSIHKQMRNMEALHTPPAFHTPDIERKTPSIAGQAPAVAEVFPDKTETATLHPPVQPVSPEQRPETVTASANAPKKTSLLSRLGFYKEDNAVPATKASPTTRPNNVPDWPAPQMPQSPAPTPTQEHAFSQPSGQEAEISVQPCVNDMIEKSKLSDLRKAFSLNDRFRYRRELFGGSETVMNKAIASLNEINTLHDCVRFLEEQYHWDFSNPAVKDFVKILEMRYI